PIGPVAAPRRDVSIHAPARGATRRAVSQMRERHVSIHAPARGATLRCNSVGTFWTSFNPRARTGRDDHASRTPVGNGAVSIHAPARGATPYRCAIADQRLRFNPRARTGRDWLGPLATPKYGCFNPRARTGRDQRSNLHLPPSICFNPRARTGRDMQRGRLRMIDHVSIHAPARGATADADADGWFLRFQSTRPHGARPSWRHGACWALSFQSTRPHGARLVAQRSLDGSVSFQSPRPHGARPDGASSLGL
ncbi:MAG: hypothetical protein RL244_788, partial [Pseudomonadota bacterium]